MSVRNCSLWQENTSDTACSPRAADTGFVADLAFPDSPHGSLCVGGCAGSPVEPAIESTLSSRWPTFLRESEITATANAGSAARECVRRRSGFVQVGKGLPILVDNNVN
jgi:hypothetical protein